ncbi:hypothetical protein [Pseudomonas sp. OTU5201]|uniref:hypothetical protein n=1 Tax=Pseudomonas sp. OTU5201 TaxID=3043850 RepID=UPI00313CF7AD
MFKRNKAFSFQVAPDNQTETDRWCSAIIVNRAGVRVWPRQEQAGSFGADRPHILTAAVASPVRAAANRAFVVAMGHDEDRHC